LRLDATYVLPLRSGPGCPSDELTAYLGWLAARIDVVVVDGSPPESFAANARRWGGLPIRHCRPDPAFAAANGKVTGVLTGLRLARHDRVVIADDDVRYGPADLARTVALLDDADLVRPQNYFSPVPWHAAWDTARTLLNRVLGGDYPGTLAVRRRLLLAAGGYDGNVLFENLELIRTVRAAGGRTVTPLDLFVARRPPTSHHFWSQRVRQAYDDFAQPWRLTIALAIVPAIGTAIARHDRFAGAAALTAVAATIGTAEIGRYRAHGRTVFRASASLLAPVWLLERGVCSWLAVASRLSRGGCPYAGGIIRRAATPQRVVLSARWSGRPRETPWTHNEESP
jgi:hypothetical protein